MLTALLTGLIIGIILAIPPGPVGVTAIKLGLFRSQKAGTQLALGNALMDTVFCLLAVFTTSYAVAGLNSLSLDYPLVTLFIQILVITGFLLFGILNIRAKAESQENLDYFDANQKFKMSFMQNLKKRGVFFLGIAIALTNFANPSFASSLAWVSVQVQNYNLVSDQTNSRLVYALGFGLGNFIWVYSLVYLVIKFKHKMSDDFLLKVKKFAGYTFIGFGTLLGWRVLAFTKWPEIIQLMLAF